MAERPDENSGESRDWTFGEHNAGRAQRFSLRAPRRRKFSIRRAVLTVTAFGASLFCLALVAAVIVSVLLLRGPLTVDLAPQIVAALNERVGHGYAFEVGSSTLEATSSGPALTLNRLAVSDAGRHPVITSQKAAISVDPLALLAGKIAPRRLEINDVDLRLLILAGGEVAISAGPGSSPVSLAQAFSIGQPKDRSQTIAERQPSDPAADHAPTASVSSNSTHGNAALRALSATLRSLVDATTGPESALGALDTVGVTGRLVLDDRTRGVQTTFNNAALSFVKEPDGSAVLKVAADGPTGPWSLTARASRSGDGIKMLTVEVSNLSLDVITLAGGLRNVGFDFDMPISAKASVRIAADGAMDQAKGEFDFGAGYFKLDDPDHEPLLVDDIAGGFHLDASTHGIIIDRTQLRAGESDFVMTGRVDMPKAAENVWTISTEASGTFGAERPGEKPIRIEHAGMDFRFKPDERRLLIDRVDVSGPEIAFETFGEVRVEADGLKLSNTASVKNMRAKVLSRLWPSFIAAPVRAWFLANLHGGTVVSGKSVVNLTDHDLALMRVQRSVPDNHVHIDYEVSDLSLDIMPGLPPLTSIMGSGTVTGDTSHFAVSRAEMEVSPGRKLVLAGGSFDTPDTDPKPTPAVVDARVTGNIDAVADLLGREALKPYANVPIDGATYKGQVDAHLGIALMLGEHVPPEDTKVTVSATATNFVAEKLIGKEGLTDTTLQLTADKTGIHAKGDGRMYGAPATFELRKPAGDAPGEATITLTMDDAARAKAGMSLGKSVTGIIAARIVVPLGAGDKKQGAVDLDFAKCAIDGIIPGFNKAAGKAGKATLSVTQHEGGSASLDNIIFDGGGLSLRGSAELDASGGLASAKISQFRLSPGDDMKVEAKQSPDGLKLIVRGTSVDGRPFLKWLTDPAPANSPDPAEKNRAIDVDFHANVLTGQNRQALTNADVRFARRGGQFRSLAVTGRLGRSPLTITTVTRGGAPIVVIKSADAGNTLSFMDLYKRMIGGRLDANLSFETDRVEGFATVHDFTLREDPAIKQLATEGLSSQNLSSDTMKINPAAVSFTKLSASFTKVGNQVTVRDGSFFGPAIGATVEGTLDFARDQVNLVGTLVPLYGVNNLFSQIPLFGPILGGGAHEGLFGLNYRITGSTSAPTLSVNPLSAMAPGFLRKIFGALDSAAQGVQDPRDRASGPASAAQAPDTGTDLGPFAQ